MMRIGSSVAAAALVMATVADAQVCLGVASFAEGPVRAGVGVEVGNDATAFGGQLGFGASVGFFATGSVARVEFDESDESATTFGANAGYSFDISPAGTSARSIELCPTVGFGYLNPLEFTDPIFGDIELSSRSFSVGLSIGGVLSSTASMAFLPSLGIDYVSERTTIEAAGDEESETDGYGVIDLGMGLVFSRRITVRPAVLFPLGLEDVDPSFNIGVSVNFGRRGTSG